MYDQRARRLIIITLQQRLKDRQLLDQIGGIPYLNALQDAVPSAANLSYYLDIVQEKSLLRKMIHTCTDVVGRVYDYEGEVDALLDEVERDILRMSESRAEGGMEAGEDARAQGDWDGGELFQPPGRAGRAGHGLCGSGPHDGRFAWRRNDRHRGAAFAWAKPRWR